MTEGLTTWVIYDHPSDYPEHYVVRPWEVAAGQIEPGGVYLYEDIDAAREMLQRLGLYRLDRQPDDDPTIMEVWL